MTKNLCRSRVRLGALVVTAVLLAAGCERTVAQHGATPSGGGHPGGSAPPEPAQPGERRPSPVSFLMRAETCARFADAVRPIALQSLGPFGFGSGGGASLAGDAAALPAARDAAGARAPAAGATAAAPRAAQEFSATNVQEAGVDEPDVVKTDGRLLVTTADGRLRVVDVTGPPRQTGVLELPDGPGDLLLVGPRAVVLSGSYATASLGRSGPVVPTFAPGGGGQTRPTTKVTIVDLADPAKPRITRTSIIDGAYVDARLIGGVVRLVTRAQPTISFPPPQPGQVDVGKAQTANAEIVRGASPASFLPAGASCSDAYVPLEAAGTGTIAVQSVDPSADAPGPAVTVVADASTVYASADRLFVATNGHDGGGPVRQLAPGGARPAETERTAIHAFDITDPTKARYVGSGDVPGRLLNSFSLSEDAGVLRVATTLDGVAGGRKGIPMPGSEPSALPVSPSQSRVTVLRPTGAEWVETGAVDGLGTGERIYAVRFLGSTGYVVTFRQVDPLYVLDLSDIRRPRVTGELKITGYSAYLHPAGEGRLLGIGQEATEQGRRAGTQLSLFDVGNPAAPAKLAGAVLPSASSSAESDHHAFLFWPAAGLVVAPVTSTADGGPAGRSFGGAVAFRVGNRSVTEAGRITHPGGTAIERSLVVGGRVLTLSRIGLADNDLRTLADGGFLAFR